MVEREHRGKSNSPSPADRKHPVNPREAAEIASDSVWALTQATAHGGYQWPADLYAVIVELTFLVRALPKTLGQVATSLDTEHQSGRITCDDGHNRILTVHAILLGLHEAARHTKPLLRALNSAAQHAGHLTNRTP